MIPLELNPTNLKPLSPDEKQTRIITLHNEEGLDDKLEIEILFRDIDNNWYLIPLVDELKKGETIDIPFSEYNKKVVNASVLYHGEQRIDGRRMGRYTCHVEAREGRFYEMVGAWWQASARDGTVKVNFTTGSECNCWI